MFLETNSASDRRRLAIAPTVLLASLVSIVAVLLAAGSASALATYSYTGNNYDQIRNSGAIGGSYNITQSVQGSFTLDQAIGANQNSVDVSADVLSFSFSDGRQTFDEGSPLSRAFFSVSTDATGEITSWRVVLEQRNVVNVLDAIETVRFGATTRDRGRQLNSPVARDEGVANNNPGDWAVTVVIPEPGTALLFGFGLVALASQRHNEAA